MDLSIFPAVGLVMLVMLAMPGNGSPKKGQANIAKQGVVTQKQRDVSYSGQRLSGWAADAKAPSAPKVLKVKKNAAPNRMTAQPKTAKTAKDIGYQKTQKTPVTASNRMAVDLDAKEDEKNYKTIYNYIRGKYKRVSQEDADKIAKSLVEYGRKHDLDPKFAAALMARESAFNRNAISSSGAKGLGQIKDMNYKSLGITDPYDISQNAEGTVSYIKRMLGIWKDKSDNVDLALASYYKGHGAVKKDKGVLDVKTQGYVQDILKNYDKLKTKFSSQ